MLAIKKVVSPGAIVRRGEARALPLDERALRLAVGGGDRSGGPAAGGVRRKSDGRRHRPVSATPPPSRHRSSPSYRGGDDLLGAIDEGRRRVRRPTRARGRAASRGRGRGRVSRGRPPGDRVGPGGRAAAGDRVDGARGVRRPGGVVPRRRQTRPVSSRGWRSPPVATTSSSGPAPRCSRPSTGWGSSTWRARAIAAHREDRAPYYHGRDVALARARFEGAVCVLAAACPSAEASALGLPTVTPAGRRWPPVEVVRPGPAGRASRLLRALATARRGFLFAPLPGSGVAQVCRVVRGAGGLRRLRRACSAPPAERSRASSAEPSGAAGPAGNAPSGCGAAARRTWRGGRGGRRRSRSGGSATASPRGCPARRRSWSGDRTTSATSARATWTSWRSWTWISPIGGPGLAARERSLATWMEAVGWARPRGRAIVQASSPGDPIVQALVRGNPDRFHADERKRRARGRPARRRGGLPHHRRRRRWRTELRAFEPSTLLVSSAEGRTVCLLALDPGRVPALGMRLRELATDGVVDRVEAEPHL